MSKVMQQISQHPDQMEKIMDYLVKAYAMHEGVRIYAAKTTDLVSYAQKRFNMWPTSIQALGRTLTIGAIMSCTYKNDDFNNMGIDDKLKN